VDPKESLMSRAREMIPARLSRVFPQILANHGLSDGLNHPRISGIGIKGLIVVGIAPNVKSLVKL
jgi:hypothetical protein